MTATVKIARYYDTVLIFDIPPEGGSITILYTKFSVTLCFYFIQYTLVHHKLIWSVMPFGEITRWRVRVYDLYPKLELGVCNFRE